MHRRLLADGKRNRAFTTALRRHVTPQIRVVDVGAGTGVWAVTAARLGAAHVVAIEQEPLLAPVIAQLADENGVADRVHVMTADAMKVRLPRDFDLIVSETIGLAAFDEGIVPLMASARRRFLKPGGRVIPQSVALMAAPAHVKLPSPTGLTIVTEYWESLASNFPYEGGSPRLLAEGARLLGADLRVDERLPRPAELQATWRIEEASVANVIALWVEATLAPRVRLRAVSGTHWLPVLLPIGPFRAASGTLELRLAHSNDGVRGWSTTLSTSGGRETSDGSPLLAYGALRRFLDARNRTP